MSLAKKIQMRLGLIVVIISLLVISQNAKANNPTIDSLKVVGQGEMSWMFLDIYHATFYSYSGKYTLRDFPQALKIVYKQNIDKKELVSATAEQWEHLSLNKLKYGKWLDKLMVLWPNIQKGDSLLFFVESNGKGAFYHNNQPIGGIDNSEFSDAFLSIWLSENSSEAKLRKQLIGG